MTQVEMAKPIMGWDYFFAKTVAEKYGGGIKLQILKIQVGRG
mgnify:CR=1 FL=1